MMSPVLHIAPLSPISVVRPTTRSKRDPCQCREKAFGKFVGHQNNAKSCLILLALKCFPLNQAMVEKIKHILNLVQFLKPIVTSYCPYSYTGSQKPFIIAHLKTGTQTFRPIFSSHYFLVRRFAPNSYLGKTFRSRPIHRKDVSHIYDIYETMYSRSTVCPAVPVVGTFNKF